MSPDSPRPGRGKRILRHPLALLLAAALALAAAGLIYDSVSGPSGESSHNAGAGVKRLTPNTVTATLAKKCKKRKGHKKRCKKRKAPVVVLPPPPPPAPGGGTPTTPPPPSLRIKAVRLSWGCNITPRAAWANVDLDLHVWNSDGSHAGWLPAGNVMENEIPDAMHLGDHNGQWDPLCESEAPVIPHEDFVDNNGNGHLITLGVCYWAYRTGPGITDPPQVDFDLQLEYTDGSTWTTGPTHPLTQPGDSIEFVHGSEPGGYDPTNVCAGV